MPRLIRTLLLGSLTFLISSYAIASKTGAAAHNEEEFIAPVEQLSLYRSILIGDITMNYLKPPSTNKHKMHRDRNFPLTKERLAKLKQDVGKIITETFTKNERFTKAEDSAKGVMKVNISLKDVRITTPTLDQELHHPTHSYTQTPIHVTLEGEFRDAANDELIAKFTNKRVDTNRFNYFYRSSKSRDDFEIRKIIKHWAYRMQKKINKAVSMN